MKLHKPTNFKNIQKITDLEFDEILCNSGVRDNFCIAVSGGPDSLALYFLAKEYAKKNDYIFSVITVDHRLRENSSKEADWLKKLFKKDKVNHYVLRWNGIKPRSNLMALARNKRYELINKKCVELGAKYLLTAHHLDDQIETFFMRLVRGSGIKGLASIARKSKMQNIILVRPLLAYSKKSLIKVLAEKKQSYIEDPTNKNLSFDRIRYRKIISSLINEGIDKNRLEKLISNLSQANFAVDYSSKIELKNCLSQNRYGHIQIKKDFFFKLPKEIQFRIINFLILNYSNKRKVVRSASILKLLANFSKSDFYNQTLNKIVFLNEKSLITLVREVSRIDKKDSISENTLFWDNFYEINSLLKKSKDLKISYFGNKMKLPKKYSKFKKIIPYLPAIWKKNKLLSVPQLDSKKSQVVSCKPINLSKFIETYNLSL